MPGRVKTPSAAKTRKPLRSSPEARRLCRAALTRFGTERKAAYNLRLSSQAAFHKILKGQMRDTLEMQAAIARADERARRAWEMIPEQGDATVDPFALRVAARELRTTLESLEALTPDN